MDNSRLSPWGGNSPSVDRNNKDLPGARLSRNGAILIALVLSLGAVLFLGRQPIPGLTFAFVIAGWILSVAIHEFAHAWIAFLGGDRSVQARGYLSLDPLKYTDIKTSLFFRYLFWLLAA